MTRTTLLILFAAIAACATAVFAHVVPPEKLHTVAEAHRRAAFVLSRNPVLWGEVRRDAETIVDAMTRVDAQRAAELQARIDAILASAPTFDAEGSPQMARTDAARAVFEELTSAVGAIILAYLDEAEHHLSERAVATTALRDAQGALGAFDPVIRWTDPDGARLLGRAFLEMSHALGDDGLLGTGAVEPDADRFAIAAQRARSYISGNFLSFSAPADLPLAPYPTASDTFDAESLLLAQLPPGSNTNKQLPRPRQILNMAARGVDESETTLIALGDMAFDSPFIFGEPAASLGISCNTCHNKGTINPQFFIPGISQRAGGMDVSNDFFAPHANNGHFDALDIPDLRGIRFLGPYGRNGRFESLREFTRNVIVNEFNGPEPEPVILDAMVAYMFEFDFLPNPNITPDGRLTDLVSDSARRGEALFNRTFASMGDMSCASCHVPSSNFVDFKRHDIGSVAGAEPFSRDGALDTPTLLGVNFTAPYFHDGSLPTLRSVSEWFNDSFDLGLNETDIDDLTEYMRAVGDGVDAYEDTYYTLEAEMEEFSFFLSSFDFLAARGQTEIIDTLFRTVAFEIRAHRWDLQDWAHMPVLERLAALMDEAAEANERGEMEETASLVAEYMALYEANREALK